MKLNITSVDMHGDNYNKTFDCQLEEGSKGKRYSYVEEGTKTTIYIYDGKVRLSREGTINSKQIFDTKKESKFRYHTTYLQSDLTLITKELIIEGKSIKLEYELYSDGMLVNKIKMSINER